jgi:hypothetical protein
LTLCPGPLAVNPQLVGSGGDGGEEVFARLGGAGLEVGLVHGVIDFLSPFC